jgi:cytochrome P450
MGHKQKALEDKDFAPLFTQAVKKFASVGVVARHMPFLHAILRTIPQHWIARISPEYGAMLAFREMNNQRIREVFERKEKGTSGSAECDILRQNTIFQELVNSDLSPEEKSYDRLSQEGQLVVGAALDTTAHAMDTTTFHILNNPEKLSRLHQELRAAMPDPQAHTPLIELEQLPYLSAVIMEGLRLSIGVSNRNARIAHEPMLYKSHVIPAGVPVSMSVPLTHHDESVYPDSYSFVPERWINGKTPDGRPLEKFFMTFGRGTRQCAGMTLAKAEMYIALAALLRRYDLELWESSRRDVDMVHDLFLPQADLASTGARVLVK